MGAGCWPSTGWAGREGWVGSVIRPASDAATRSASRGIAGSDVVGRRRCGERVDRCVRCRGSLLSWTVLAPLIAIVVLALTFGQKSIGTVLVVVVAVLLAASVLAAVQHAEVVAHRVGEPMGSLVLAVAVTVIEVGLIVTLMVAGGPARRRWPGTPCSPR